MKIAHINVIATMSTGRIAVELCRLAMENGHRVLLCHSRDFCPPDVPSLKIGGKADLFCHALLARLTDRQGFFSKRATQRLVRELKSYRPDVVHLHNLHGYYLHLPTLFEYLRREDIPTVWTLHDCWAFTGRCAYYTTACDAPPPDGVRRRGGAEGCERWQTGCGRCPQKQAYPRTWFLDQSAKNWRDKRALFTELPHMVLATPSEWLRDQVKRSFLGKYPVYALPNGIDLSAFAPCTDQDYLWNTVRYYGLAKAREHHLILSVAGVWEERKGLDDLIRLAETLGDGYRVVALGLDEYQIKALPPHTVVGVRPTGNLNDLCALYTVADVCVSLSHGETMGMTLVEALACGTQVLCYDSTAMPEIVTKEVGLTVPLGDIEAAAQAVQALCEDPREPADCLARAAQYDAPRRFQAYMKLYDGMYLNSPAYMRAVEAACGPAAGKGTRKVE